MIISIGNDFFMWWSSRCFKHDEKWGNFDGLWSIRGHQLKTWNSTGELSDFDQNLVKLGRSFSSSPSRGGIKIGSTLKIDVLTHRRVMDKPLWGLAKLITKIKFCFKKWPFVTTTVAFYVNFPKNRDFDDLGKVMMKILNLMCPDGPGWWVGAQRCLKHDIQSSRSSLRSKNV